MPQKRRRRRRSGDPNYPYIYKKYRDKTVRSRVPIFTKPWSVPQEAHRERVAAASAYAVAVAADPVAVAFYRAVIKRRKKRGVWSVRNVAMADFFHSPVIGQVDWKARRGEPGASLRISVEDKWGAAAVTVGLWADNRVVLAAVPAVYELPYWFHTFADPLPEGTDWSVIIAATDRPGNRTTKVVSAANVKWD